jgi:hypothetical protein
MQKMRFYMGKHHRKGFCDSYLIANERKMYENVFKL